MQSENLEIGLRIRNERKNQKLSREKLSEMSGISTQFLADIETGKKGMTVTTLKKICTSLNITADSVVFGTDKETPYNFNAMLSSLSRDEQSIVKRIISLLQK